MTAKLELKTASGGKVILDPTDTAVDRTLTLPALSGSFVTADTSGNVGIGVAPSTDWRTSDRKQLQIVGGSVSAGETFTALFANVVLDPDAVTKYLYNGTASSYSLSSAGHIWSTAASGTAGNTVTIIERARIDSSGNFLMGTASQLFTGYNQARLCIDTGGNLYNALKARVNGTNQVCYFGGSTVDNYLFAVMTNTAENIVGTISVTSTATAYNTSSDYRLKEDIQPVLNPIDRLMQLKPINFAWKVDGTRVDGFLAHEAQEVVPEAVTGTKDAVDADGNPEYQGIDQAKLVPLLTAALQELNAKVDAQAAEIAALKGETL
jgi:hypothetical protein